MGNIGEVIPRHRTLEQPGAMENGVENGEFSGVLPGFGSHIVRRERKSTLFAYLLAIPPLGLFGAHHFYLGRPTCGVMYVFTLGLAGFGWLFDLFRMPLFVRYHNEGRYDHDRPKTKTSLDAYLLWGSPFGLLGFHQYYLGRWTWGLAYTFTLGLGAVGWICDMFRMGSIVKDMNERKMRQMRPIRDPNEIESEEERMTLSDAYVLGFSVFGLVGGHHYYMGRFFFGMLYTFSLGLVGIGWIVDWFNMPVVFRRAKRIREHGDDGIYYLDDAYRYLWPFGFLGLHHFYLRRPGRGVLYLFTLGLLFFGWLADFCRLQRLVKEANKKLKEERDHLEEIRDRLGPSARVVGGQRAYVAYATRDGNGGMSLPTPQYLGGNQATPQHAESGNSADQSRPPPYANVSDSTYAQPPPYRAVVMTTITEDEENSLNEEASAPNSVGSLNKAFKE